MGKRAREAMIGMRPAGEARRAGWRSSAEFRGQSGLDLRLGQILAGSEAVNSPKFAGTFLTCQPRIPFSVMILHPNKSTRLMTNPMNCSETMLESTQSRRWSLLHKTLNLLLNRYSLIEISPPTPPFSSSSSSAIIPFACCPII